MKRELRRMSTRELTAIWLADYFWAHSPKNDGRLSSGSSCDLDHRFDEMESIEAVLRERYASAEQARQWLLEQQRRASFWLGRRLVDAYVSWAWRREVRGIVSNRTISEVTFPSGSVVKLTIQRGKDTHYSREELVQMLDALGRDAPEVHGVLRKLVREAIVTLRKSGGLVSPDLLLAASWLDVDVPESDAEQSRSLRRGG